MRTSRSLLLLLLAPALWPAAAAAEADPVEWLVEVGVHHSRLRVAVGAEGVDDRDDGALGPVLGAGVRRSADAARHHWLGMQLEWARVRGDPLLAWRAIDYQYRPGWEAPLAFGAFLGVARLDTGAPALGWYVGVTASWQRLFAGLDLGLDLRLGDSLARDKLLAGDPPATVRPDLFYGLTGAVLSLTWRR